MSKEALRPVVYAATILAHMAPKGAFLPLDDLLTAVGTAVVLATGHAPDSVLVMEIVEETLKPGWLEDAMSKAKRKSVHELVPKAAWPALSALIEAGKVMAGDFRPVLEQHEAELKETGAMVDYAAYLLECAVARAKKDQA
jgi:hypothetical protein